MSIRISPTIAARTHAGPWSDCVRSVDVPALAVSPAPIARLDHFRVTGPAAGPRLGPGVAAVTYVLRDSETSLRSRDSLGNDVVMRPGGLVWMRAGCGVVHEHLPARFGRELRCLQLCMHLGAQDSRGVPAVSRLEPEQVPEWWDRSGDSVRVVAGSYAGHSPPTTLAPAFTLLDVRLRSAVYFDVAAGHDTVVYILGGFALALTESHSRGLGTGEALALHNSSGNALLQLVGSAHLLILDRAASDAAVQSHDRGDAVAPLSKPPPLRMAQRYEDATAA